MGKFEKNIPDHIKKVEAEITRLYRERNDIDWGHECDCEFCDRDQDGDPEAQEKYDQLEKQIHEQRSLLKRLKAHARIHNVPVAAESSKK